MATTTGMVIAVTTISTMTTTTTPIVMVTVLSVLVDDEDGCGDAVVPSTGATGAPGADKNKLQ